MTSIHFKFPMQPLEHGREDHPAPRLHGQPELPLMVEKSFGWLKQTGPLRQVKLRGLHEVDRMFVLSCAAHNLLRLPRLIAQRSSEGPASRVPEPLSESENRPQAASANS